jgi:hypothetical protein
MRQQIRQGFGELELRELHKTPGPIADTKWRVIQPLRHMIRMDETRMVNKTFGSKL